MNASERSPDCTQRSLALNPSEAVATAARPVISQLASDCRCALTVGQSWGGPPLGRVLQPPSTMAPAMNKVARHALHERDAAELESAGRAPARFTVPCPDAAAGCAADNGGRDPPRAPFPIPRAPSCDRRAPSGLRRCA